MRTKNSYRTLPKKKPVEESEGQRLLALTGKSQQRIADDLIEVGIPASQPGVRKWLKGTSRPEALMRVILKRLYNIPIEAWFSDAELAIIAKVDAVLGEDPDSRTVDPLAWTPLHPTKSATH